MFDQLRNRANELRPGLGDVLSTLIESGIVQGAVLELDRLWLEAFLWDLFGDPFWEVWLAAAGVYYPPIKWDFTYRPYNWAEHCKAKGFPPESGPFVVRVILYPSPSSPISESQYPNRFGDYPIVYEKRPPLEAVAMPQIISWPWRKIPGLLFGATVDEEGAAVSQAISVGRATPTPTAGTLGGVLRDSGSGARYLVSCAHVMGQTNTTVYTPGPYENRGMHAIGIVRFSSLPPIAPLNMPCNNRAAPEAARLDVSLAELLPDTLGDQAFSALSQVDHVRLAHTINSGQHVYFVGKVSGKVSAYIGGCTIWYSINFPDGRRCFGSLFEIVAPAGRRGPLARKGDSGAWILDRLPNVSSWLGMLVASVPEKDRAYCCFAEDIFEDCRQSFPSLTLVP